MPLALDAAVDLDTADWTLDGAQVGVVTPDPNPELLLLDRPSLRDLARTTLLLLSEPSLLELERKSLLLLDNPTLVEMEA